MHEFSICRALLSQVAAIADEHRAGAVVSMRLRVGPLSGVEPGLLARAFSVARFATIAEGAELIIETPPVEVRCRTCAGVSETDVNHLVCTHCGDFRTELVSGDELILISVELDCADEADGDMPAAASLPAPS